MYTWILVFTVFLKNRNIISKMKRSQVTDYAALKEGDDIYSKKKKKKRNVQFSFYCIFCSIKICLNKSKTEMFINRLTHRNCWLHTLLWKSYWSLCENSSFHYEQKVNHQNVINCTLDGSQGGRKIKNIQKSQVCLLNERNVSSKTKLIEITSLLIKQIQI